MIVGKPVPYALRGEPRTWGEHLRRQRFLRGLRQKDVADEIGVGPFTILNWERGKSAPKVRFIPWITLFLGYCLWQPPRHLGDVLRQAREATGLSQEQFGALAGADPASVSRWETQGRRLPSALIGWLKQPTEPVPRAGRSERRRSRLSDRAR